MNTSPFLTVLDEYAYYVSPGWDSLAAQSRNRWKSVAQRKDIQDRWSARVQKRKIRDAIQEGKEGGTRKM